jgi:hypothetical protein
MCVLDFVLSSPFDHPVEPAGDAAHAKHKEHATAQLLKAACNGDVMSTRLLLRRGCPPDVCDYDGRSALMLAASRGFEVCVCWHRCVGVPHVVSLQAAHFNSG